MEQQDCHRPQEQHAVHVEQPHSQAPQQQHPVQLIQKALQSAASDQLTPRLLNHWEVVCEGSSSLAHPPHQQATFVVAPQGADLEALAAEGPQWVHICQRQPTRSLVAPTLVKSLCDLLQPSLAANQACQPTFAGLASADVAVCCNPVCNLAGNSFCQQADEHQG